MTRSILAACAFLISALAPLHSTCAADAPAAGSGELAEIIVTAEKREESSQKTPVSIEVYTAAELQQKGIVDLQSLAANDTSLNFNSGSGEGYLTLRGVSSHDTTEVGSPSVPVSVDGFVSNRSWSLISALFDLERIEVLRGPQGTLFGRSSTGGLINVISNKPHDAFEAAGSVEYGNYNALNTTGVLNMPVSDVVQVRVAYASRKHDGYRTSPQFYGDPPAKGDDEDSQAARLQVAIQPFADAHALLAFEDIRQTGVGVATQLIPFVSNPNSLTGDILHDKPALGSPRDFNFYGDPYTQLDSKIFKWNFAYEALPGQITATYLGGYGLEEWHHGSPAGNLFSFLYGGPLNYYPVRTFVQNEEPHTQNHELRFTSSAAGPFIWQAGLYYFKEDNNLFSHLVLNPGSGGPPGTPGNAQATTATDLYQFIFPSVDQTSKAVYAQASYSVTDTSKVTAGVRYNKDEIVRQGVFNLYLFGSPGISEYGTASSNKTTWHVGYDWSPTSTNLVYAKVDNGYKPGGFGSAGCPDYKPETVLTYEIGSKNRFNDNRLQLNVAGFLDNYKDQQVSEFTSACVGGTSTSNAGKSRIYGVEAELTALAGPVGKFDASLSYLHARYLSFLVPPTVYPSALETCRRVVTNTAGSDCDLGGNTLTQSPDYTVALGYEHAWDLSSESHLDFRVEGKYTSKVYFDSFNFNDARQGGFGIGNAYLDFVHEKYTMGVFVRNFADAVYLTSGAEQSGFGEGQYAYTYGAPRTFGVRFTASVK